MEVLPFLVFLVFLVAIIGFTINFLMRGVQIVPEGNVAIVERQGRFLRVLDPGRHYLLPLDRIRNYVPLQEFDETLHADRVIMRNAVVIGIDMYVQYRIAHYYPQQVSPEQARRMQPEAVIHWSRGRVRQRDVYNATYSVDNWQEKTRKEALAVMQDCMAMVDLAKDVFGTQVNALKQISAVVKRQLNERTVIYGVEVTDVNLNNPVIDDSTREFISSIRRAEMQNRIKLLEAESQAKIQQVEAENQAKIQQRLNLNKEELLRWHYIQTLKEISQKNPGARFVLAGEDMGRVENEEEMVAMEQDQPSDIVHTKRTAPAYSNTTQPSYNEPERR